MRTSLLDAKEEAAGLTLNSAKLEKDDNNLHVTTGVRFAHNTEAIVTGLKRTKNEKLYTKGTKEAVQKAQKTNFFYVHFVAN